ncbi:MAG: hypothetical protein JWQ02_2358, partial [Capsulimonas sp.]|nr:hypothetical protein [Capsulimonas sp.]
SLKPPAYVLPGLGGAVSTLTQQRNLRQAQARQQRQDQGTDRTSMTIIAVVMFGFFVQIFSRIFGGGWILHLLQPVEAALPHAQFVLAGVFFSWPYFAVKLMDATLPFYHGSLPTLVYLLPLLALTRIAGVLRSGAALTVGEASEISRAPIARRAATISRWTQRLTIILLAGYAWNVCITSGDTAALLGRGSGGGWDQAGLLLLFGLPALLNATWRAITMRVTLSGQPLRRRPIQLTRRLIRRTGRPLRAALAMFVVVCLLGGVSPVSGPVLQTLAQFALTTGMTLCYCLGVNVLLASPMQGAQRRWLRAAPALLFFSPIVAIFTPFPALWHLSAASPLLAWLHLFPGVEAEMARGALNSDGVVHWPYGATVPVTEYLAAPLILSLICLWLGYRYVGGALPQSEPAAPREPKQKAAVKAASPRAVAAQLPSRPKRIVYGNRTEALMGWICARIDNPLFIRDIRSRTRSGAWYQWVFIVPALFVLLEVATALYPDLAMGFAEGLSWIRFFHISTPNWPLVTPETYASVAGVILTLQVCALGLRMPAQCEEIFRRDQQTGGLGFILLTPLRSAQIFWGLIWANLAASIIAWAAFAAVLLALYLQAAASPEVGLGPALTAWMVGQIFVATMLAMGAAVGSAMATHTTALRTGRGISTLLAVGIIGIATSLIFTNYQEFFEAISPLWVQTTWRMMFGVAAALPVTVLAFFYAQWRLKRLRDGDIAFGENIPS